MRMALATTAVVTGIMLAAGSADAAVLYQWSGKVGDPSSQIPHEPFSDYLYFDPATDKLNFGFWEAQGLGFFPLNPAYPPPEPPINGHTFILTASLANAPVAASIVVGGYHWEEFYINDQPAGGDDNLGDDISGGGGFPWTFSGTSASYKFNNRELFTWVPHYKVLYEWDGPVLGDITIDPADIGESFSFTLAEVPEPASWALFILGFGAVGATLRAGRRVSPVARV